MTEPDQMAGAVEDETATHDRTNSNGAATAALVAPFVFCDFAPVYGFCDGVVCVTLAAARHTVGPDGAKVHDAVVVGHLRMGLAASQSLRSALASAEAMASKSAVSH